jgi:hypothetical protein
MLTKPNSHVQPPPNPAKPPSLLTQFVGSEQGAARACEDIRRRQRNDTIRNRSIVQGIDRDQPETVLRVEIRRLRDHLSDERRARAELEAEVLDLAAAVDYLRDLLKEAINGKDRTRCTVA